VNVPGRLRCLIACLGVVLPAQAADEFITVASTTSTEQSGLFGHLLPEFTRATGIEVRVVALGTGQALDMGRRGDADVLFVHDRDAEETFVGEGYGIERLEVMYNDFVLAGPRSDVAGVRGERDIVAAFRKIERARAPFVSRGDRSGTHMAELRLWQAAGIDLGAAEGPWYRETGSGMGPALNTAAEMGGYILTDRGTWLSFRNRRDLELLVHGDARLFNQYGVVLVNPARYPSVKADAGRAFIDWLVSPAGQRRIASFEIDGQPLFFPNAPRAATAPRATREPSGG
jgi:tungstate transport system substrate-binding protein